MRVRTGAVGALGCALCFAGCDRGATAPIGSASQALHATPGGVDILTFHGDNMRTGWNSHETTLTLANVRAETFGLLAQLHDATGEPTGQPLFVSNITVHDDRTGGDSTGDVIFLATMNDHVYAIDADTLDPMWDFDFEGLQPSVASDLVSCQSPYNMGVLGTPVISPDKQTLYVVGRVTQGAPDNNWLQGYALSTHDGSVRARFIVGETQNADGTRTPVAFDGFDRGNPIHLTYNSHQQSQRSALLLEGNYLYVANGGICDTAGFRGWLLAYDVTHLSNSAPPAGVWVPSPQSGGGMWAGGGPASDGANVYAAVGNGRAAMRAGTADNQQSLASAVAKLTPTLGLDNHACFNATTLGACGAGDQANLSNIFMPRNAELLSRDNIPDDDPNMDLMGPDEDLGASGPMLLPPPALPENMGSDMGRRLLAIGGKDGMFYLIDRDHMGGIGPSPLNGDGDVPNLVGAELWGQELFQHSTSGGIRSTAAYFETHSGRYVYTLGVDSTTASDAAQGVVGLRVTAGTDPSPMQCAGQFRQIAYQGGNLPCPTIWGNTMRPTLTVAWTGTGGTSNGGIYVSSNGPDNGIVWVGQERGGPDGAGVLVAYPADPGVGVGNVTPPLYRSDRVPDDNLPGIAATFAAPIVANGRVYVTGSTFLYMYGLLPAARALPPVPDSPPPPNCADGVTWESLGHPFMQHYCTSCHNEYNNLGFIQRRNDRVADAILPTDGSPPAMPLMRPGMTVPVPTDDERNQIALWLRCGAPTTDMRMHAGYADIQTPNGVFTGDGNAMDPNRAGTLSPSRMIDATLTNPFNPYLPNSLFDYDRTGAATWRVPVPGAGHYAVSLYFAETPCAAGETCGGNFNVTLAGQPFLQNFNIAQTAGAPNKVIAASAALDLPAGARLLVDVGAPGRLQALEVVRTDPCTTNDQCPLGFDCMGGSCQVNAERAMHGVGGDAGTIEAGVDGGVDPDAGDGFTVLPDGRVVGPDGGIGSEPMEHGGCHCRAAGNAGSARTEGALALAAVAAVLGATRRRRNRAA